MPLRPVLPGVFHIDLPWTNAWLLTSDHEAALIDTGTCRDRPALAAALREAGVGDRRALTTVLLTHAHCDHAGNAAWLAREHSAEIAAHELEEPYIAGGASYAGAGWRAILPASIVFRAGDILFPVQQCPLNRPLRGGMIADSPIGELRVIATPGHTAGHAAFFHELNGWLFSGDALLTVIPFRRKPGLSIAPPLFSVSIPDAVDSARSLARLAPIALLPGHGWPLLDNAAERIRVYSESFKG